MDTFADGGFHPDSNVTREDFARLLYLNTPLRQFARHDAEVHGRFGGVRAHRRGGDGQRLDAARLELHARPAWSRPTGSTFNPTANVTRLETAVALVRALGLDAEAKAKAGQVVTAQYNGQASRSRTTRRFLRRCAATCRSRWTRGLLQAFFNLEQGPFDFQPTLKARVKAGDATTRAFMAYALDNFRQRFVAGN
jgi:serine protease AprX